MANSIIEKLGITPGPWDPAEISLKIGESEKQTINDLQCALKAPEMLLWIIGMLQSADNNDMEKAAKLLSLAPELIEKACYPKKWQQIKELLNA